MMVDLGKLRGFIETMDGDKAEISKANLVAIERELTEARRVLDGTCLADGITRFYRGAAPLLGEAQ